MQLLYIPNVIFLNTCLKEHIISRRNCHRSYEKDSLYQSAGSQGTVRQETAVSFWGCPWPGCRRQQRAKPKRGGRECLFKEDIVRKLKNWATPSRLSKQERLKEEEQGETQPGEEMHLGSEKHRSGHFQLVMVTINRAASSRMPSALGSGEEAVMPKLCAWDEKPLVLASSFQRTSRMLKILLDGFSLLRFYPTHSLLLTTTFSASGGWPVWTRQRAPWPCGI